MRKRYVFTCGTAKYTPIWMYYIKYLLVMLESIINLFTLPFHTQIDISTTWMVHMIRYGLRKHKERKAS